ncbi:MAG TPA: phosphatase PAP2 family protein [Anaeromyxobacteraceae bacterium]|nr:phosphatase PAP2 family protein [Anaeromyxobacteraceae bacterium]
MRTARAAAALLLLAAAPRALAERGELRYRLEVDLPLTLGATAFWAGTELAKPQLAPSTCRVCGVDGLDARARQLLVLPWIEPPRRASDVLVGAVMPLGVATHALLASRAGGQGWREGFVDLLVVSEAVTIAGSLGQVVKYAVGRQRPFVHYGNYTNPDRRPDPDDNLSFWSGHTAMAFSLAVGAGTVAHLRRDPGAPWVLGVGLGAATVVGYLRIAGDKHYLTDVLVGAAVGSAAGWAVPWLMHRPETSGPSAPGPRVAVTPLPLGIALTF